ncbi:hypothetical protein VTL71DRAFT_3336 [Oculimacula yallundae]|uniref:Uncharacterized protein n=1 Tax=Oculimacula yallundae TaxID=86028 RepID=A0ABR4C6V0_9HELO
MQLNINILLGLVTAVSAVDIAFYGNDNCSGRFNSCTNMNPNQCCNQANLPSLAFNSIPSNWNLVVKAYDSNGNQFACSRQKNTVESLGRTSVCLRGQAPYNGGGYAFKGVPGGRKRDDGAFEDAHVSTDCVRPDTFTDEDGAEYSAKDLDQAEFDELLEHWNNGTSVSEIATSFTSFKLK